MPFYWFLVGSGKMSQHCFWLVTLFKIPCFHLIIKHHLAGSSVSEASFSFSYCRICGKFARALGPISVHAPTRILKEGETPSAGSPLQML